MRVWAALGVLGAIVCKSPGADARVIWMDDFSDDVVSSAKHKPSRSYVRAGEDYQFVQPSSSIEFYVAQAGSADENLFFPRSNAVAMGDNNATSEGSLTVTMDRFDVFDTAGPDRLFHFQFDFGVDKFAGTSGPRVVLKPDNSSTSALVIGFAARNILSGAGDELFFYAMAGGANDNPTPTLANALGLNEEGTAFLAGFDFGVRDFNNADVNDTTSRNAMFGEYDLYEMYRFSVTFDGTTYSGTVQRINLNSIISDDPEDIATFSITVPQATLSNTDNRDRFIIYTGVDNLSLTAAVDNISFSVTPEPAGSAAMIALAAALACRRRRH